MDKHYGDNENRNRSNDFSFFTTGVHQAQRIPDIMRLKHLKTITSSSFLATTKQYQTANIIKSNATFSPVVGHIPPLAKVAPITATVSVFTLNCDRWHGMFVKSSGIRIQVQVNQGQGYQSQNI